ncbi:MULTISPECIES: ice-binding family protein [unclassified Nesterenkonia]|uniref:ice-binding family protein n=1 Tax=unclassified Nesterenkonia TaxID=2629769 RepID=UPI00314560DB
MKNLLELVRTTRFDRHQLHSIPGGKMNNTTSSARSAPAVQRPDFSTRLRVGLSALLVTFVVMAVALSFSSAASAATTPVVLGTAGSYSVLGGQTVTNTGPTILSGDLGVSPGNAITGFPPGLVGGTTHAGDAEALQAQSDLVTAYNDVAGRAPTASIAGDLGGQTLVDGVYNSTGAIELTGTLTLDGQGDPNSVFIFQVASSLITATSSNVSLINGAQACNVYWQVGSSATLGTGSTFVGSILALTSISATTGATVQGRALARNGAVTLDSNTFTTTSCAVESTGEPTETPVPTEEPTETPATTETPVPSEEPTETSVPTEEPTAVPVPTDEPIEVPVPAEEPTEVAVPTEERTDVPAATDEPTEVAVSTEEPTEAPVPTDEPTDSAGPTNTESQEASASPVESDAPSGSDSPTASDTTDDDATESAALSDSDDATIEADASAADTDDDSAEAASDSSDLPSTGIGALTSVLVGLSVLLILGGATLLIIRRQRSTSSD